ncbi:MAG: glutathione S-transferase family protein, partial [Lysobacter sp.]|nr:glutathione S-transferase family protein [Lysobacter sp.]
EWLMFQMGGVGPMFGQYNHFANYAPEKLPYAIERYIKETSRLYGVLDKHLSDGREFIAGDYSIADMACYPWIVAHEYQQQNMADFPHLKRWFERIQVRPATVVAYEKGQGISSSPVVDDEARKILFGQDRR